MRFAAPGPIAFCWVLLLCVVLYSHFRPQVAFHFWSQLFGLLVLGILGIALFLTLKAAAAGFARWNKTATLALGLGVLWPVWWLIRWTGAPVPALGLEGIHAILPGAMVFGAAFLLCNASVPLLHGRRWDGPAFAARAFVAVMGIIALHGLYQVYGPAALPGTHAATLAALEGAEADFSPAVLEGIRHALSEGRASGVTGQPNVFAGLLALALPLALAGVLAPGGRALRIAAGIAAAVMAFGILASGSRGGLLAMVLGVGLMVLLSLPALLRRLPAAASVAVLALVTTGAAADRWLGAGTIRQRLHYWESGFAMWSENWLLGLGPGAYEVFYPRFRVEGAQETVYAHNWFVQWGTEVGIVGLLLFAGWVLLCLFVGLRWWRHAESPGQRILAAGLMASVATILVHGLVEFTLQYREPYFDLALLLGILLGRGMQAVPSAVARPFRLPAFVPVVATVVVLLGGGIALNAWHLRPHNAEMHREAAEYLLYTARDPAAAEDAATRGLRHLPGHPWLLEIRAFARMEQGDRNATDDFVRAIARHPNSARLRRSQAEYHLQTGNRQRAIELLREAVELHPLNVSGRIRLAEILHAAGEEEEARAILTEALGMFASATERDQGTRLARELGVPTPM